MADDGERYALGEAEGGDGCSTEKKKEVSRGKKTEVRNNLCKRRRKTPGPRRGGKQLNLSLGQGRDP